MSDPTSTTTNDAPRISLGAALAHGCCGEHVHRPIFPPPPVKDAAPKPAAQPATLPPTETD